MAQVSNSGNYSFPSTIRLRKRSEFLRLSNTADRFASRGILVVWCSNDFEAARLGITVSKKNGCAVTRNRIKRYVREVFRHNKAGLPAVDLNVIARNGSATMSYESLRCELLKAFDQISRSLCSKTSHS